MKQKTMETIIDTALKAFLGFSKTELIADCDYMVAEEPPTEFLQ